MDDKKPANPRWAVLLGAAAVLGIGAVLLLREKPEAQGAIEAARSEIDGFLRDARTRYEEGDTAAARDSLSSASLSLASFESIAPGDVAALGLRREAASLQARCLFAERNPEEALAAAREGLEAARRAAALSQDEQIHRALRRSLELLATTAEALGDEKSADEAFDELIRLAEQSCNRLPGDPAATRDLADAWLALADCLFGRGRLDEARSQYSRAADLARFEWAKRPADVRQTVHALRTLRRAADFDLATGGARAALELVEEAGRIFQRSGIEAVDSVETALLKASQARSLLLLNRDWEGFPAAGDALQQFEGHLAATPRDAGLLRALAEALVTRATLAARLGRIDEARACQDRWAELEPAFVAASADKIGAELIAIQTVAGFVNAWSPQPLDVRVRHQLPALRRLREMILAFGARGRDVEPEMQALRPVFVDLELHLGALSQGIDVAAPGAENPQPVATRP